MLVLCFLDALQNPHGLVINHPRRRICRPLPAPAGSRRITANTLSQYHDRQANYISHEQRPQVRKKDLRRRACLAPNATATPITTRLDTAGSGACLFPCPSSPPPPATLPKLDVHVSYFSAVP